MSEKKPLITNGDGKIVINSPGKIVGGALVTIILAFGATNWGSLQWGATVGKDNVRKAILEVIEERASVMTQDEAREWHEEMTRRDGVEKRITSLERSMEIVTEQIRYDIQELRQDVNSIVDHIGQRGDG